jgi:hypothetical protein
MSRTLEHLTVVELAGPRTEWCGKLFAQAGARVVLLEPPGGAETRSYGPWFRGRKDRESSLHFWHYHTDKESAVLDLATKGGRDTFLGLLADADVLLDGSEPGGLAGALADFVGTLTDRAPWAVRRTKATYRLAEDMALHGALNFGNQLNQLLRLNGQLAPIHSRSEGVKRALKTDIADGG